MLLSSRRELTSLPQTLAEPPQNERRGKTNRDTRKREDRITPSVAESGVHGVGEKWERETAERAEESGGRDCGGGIAGVGVDDVTVQENQALVRKFVF